MDFFPGLSVIVDQFDPFRIVPREEARGGLDASESGTYV